MLSERIESWEQQWEKRGILKGETLLLKRQLIRRFGPLPDWVAVKLAEAEPAQLEWWGERVLDAPSLVAVFEGDQ
jgi:hypothetical protein